MCCWNKRRPDTNRLVKKLTKLCGAKEALENLSRRCTGDHEHDRIQGKMKVPDENGNWKTMNVSVWAGAYTPEFAEAILQGAEAFLQQRYEQNGDLKINAAFPTEEIFSPHTNTCASDFQL